MCVCSSSSCSFVEHTSLALWNSVLMTLYLLDMAWWLSHCRYWLVWVGFLYTVVNRLPSLCGVTTVSKKGIALSALMFSAVNFMFSSIELMCWKKLFFALCFYDNKSVIHKSFPQTWEVWCCLQDFCFKIFHENVGHYGAKSWSHCCPFYLLIVLPLEYKNSASTTIKIKWPSGYSICYQGNRICLLTFQPVWLFHLPQ